MNADNGAWFVPTLGDSLAFIMNIEPMTAPGRRVRTILVLAGGIAIAIGVAVLFFPHAFSATYGVTLGADPSLLSDIRGSGGAILASGIVITAGAFARRLTFTALVISSLFYLAYALSRALGLVLDGVPASGVIAAMVAEFVLGALSVFALTSARGLRP